MSPTIEKVFRSPYAAPNGLQVTDEGLWIVDQLTDRVALVETGKPHDYGATRILRHLPTESSTTSGITYGGGALWLAANGPGERWRTPRPTDAVSGEIVKADPATGATLGRFPLPGGGGTHGIEYDRFEDGKLWLTTIHSDTISQVAAEDWSVVRSFPITLGGGTHGIVRVDDGMWVAHRTTRRILKLDIDTGAELELGFLDQWYCLESLLCLDLVAQGSGRVVVLRAGASGRTRDGDVVAVTLDAQLAAGSWTEAPLWSPPWTAAGTVVGGWRR